MKLGLVGQDLLTMEQLDKMKPASPEYESPFVVYLATDSPTNINGKVFHVEKTKSSGNHSWHRKRHFTKQMRMGCGLSTRLT